MLRVMVILVVAILSGCSIGALSQENIALHVQKDAGINSNKIIKGQHCTYTIINKETAKAYYFDGVIAVYEKDFLIYMANPLVGGISAELEKRFKISEIQSFATAIAPKGRHPLDTQVQLYLGNEIVVASMISTKLTSDEAGTNELIKSLRSLGIKEKKSKGAILDRRSYRLNQNYHIFFE